MRRPWGCSAGCELTSPGSPGGNDDGGGGSSPFSMSRLLGVSNSIIAVYHLPPTAAPVPAPAADPRPRPRDRARSRLRAADEGRRCRLPRCDVLPAASIDSAARSPRRRGVGATLHPITRPRGLAISPAKYFGPIFLITLAGARVTLYIQRPQRHHPPKSQRAKLVWLFSKAGKLN